MHNACFETAVGSKTVRVGKEGIHDAKIRTGYELLIGETNYESGEYCEKDIKSSFSTFVHSLGS